MFIASLASISRLCIAAPRFTRSVVNRAVSRPVPAPRGIVLAFQSSTHAHQSKTFETDIIATPADFLKAIGRSSDTKLQVEQWDALWKLSGHDLRQKGLAVRDRRYILWCMEKYRSGLPIESFAHEPRPKKTVRGWGPSVQNGKRIRSRRDKSKKR